MKVFKNELEVVQSFESALERFGERLAAAGDDSWGAPTPCSEWDVRALVNHVVSELAWIPPLLDGKHIADVGDRLDGDLLGDDPPAAWRQVARDALVAASTEGAPERTVHLSAGDASADRYLAEVTADVVVHTWDLARSIGADERLDPTLVEFAEATLRPLIDSWRAAGLLGYEIELPEIADRQTALLALLGRRA
ncbi:MAG: TIGR03086 family metal-binding protein [Actinomycetota bacterium]